MSRLYCSYCGRVAHRCACDDAESPLHQFFARNGSAPESYYPHWITSAYKRGVPPQIKRKERYQLRKHYTAWYTTLVEAYGEICLNCGADTGLVIDHIISIAKGGISEPSNLQLLCAECNRLKGKLCIDCRSDTN